MYGRKSNTNANAKVIYVWGKKEIDIGNGVVLRVDAGSKKKNQFIAGTVVALLALTALIVMTMAIVTPNALAKELDEPAVEVNTALAAKMDMPEIETIELPAAPVPEIPEPELEFVGVCRITAYCACAECCGEWANDRPVDENGNVLVIGAEGTELISGVSVAGKWAFGTELYIPAVSEECFLVQDRTSQYVQEYYEGMVVDIYIDGHDECYEYVSTLPEWTEVYRVV